MEYYTLDQKLKALDMAVMLMGTPDVSKETTRDVDLHIKVITRQLAQYQALAGRILFAAESIDRVVYSAPLMSKDGP